MVRVSDQKNIRHLFKFYFIWKLKNIKEQYTVLIHITVPNNVLNLQLFNLFMFEILRTEKLKFSISCFCTSQTGKKGHKVCLNNILHYCVTLSSIHTWERVCIYKYTCVYHLIVLNLATVHCKLSRRAVYSI